MGFNVVVLIELCFGPKVVYYLRIFSGARWLAKAKPIGTKITILRGRSVCLRVHLGIVTVNARPVNR